MTGTDLTTEQGHKLREYEVADVEIALALLARNGGKAYTRTSKQLADDGLAIPPATIQYWHTTAFPARYAEIRLEIQNSITSEAIGQANDIAVRSAHGEQVAVERTIEGIEGKGTAGMEDYSPPVAIEDTKDVANMARAARELHQVKRGNVEVGNLLAGKPTEIKELREPAELLKVLAPYLRDAIDVEATEVTD